VHLVRRAPAGLLFLLTLVLAAGCSGDSSGSAAGAGSPSAPPASSSPAQPAICADLAALQQTGTTVRNLPKDKQSLPALKDAAVTAKQQVNQLVADARGQYQVQTAPISAAASALQTSVDAAQNNPNAASLSAVSASAAGLATALQNLKQAIPSGC
jgi:phosphoketolase